MFKLRRLFTSKYPTFNQQSRCVSALYISGANAMENYATLHPYMDFRKTLVENQKELSRSILMRNLNMDLNEILQKYDKFQKLKARMKDLESQRASVSVKLKELLKMDPTAEEGNILKEIGKRLREETKALKDKAQPVEDDFIHAFLNLPNSLHNDCPCEGKEKILYRNTVQRNEQGEPHLKHTNLIRFIKNTRYYMMDEAAIFDLECTQALTRYFVETAGFVQTANPDFARRVLLEANATPLENYHMVMEKQLENKLNTAYLVGGASWESYLAYITKLSIQPNVLPLRMVSCGRSYLKIHMQPNQVPNLYAATQMSAVQTFVATLTAEEAAQQMHDILNYAIDFYKALNLHFRIIYADASAIYPSECLRAVIEVYSPAEKRYITVGHISNYGDFVSKRLLFAMKDKKEHHFMYLVGGPVLYTGRLIAALLENNIALEQCKLLGAYTSEQNAELQKAIKEFKDIFK